MLEEHIIQARSRHGNRANPRADRVERGQELGQRFPAFLDDDVQALAFGDHVHDQRMAPQRLPHRGPGRSRLETQFDRIAPHPVFERLGRPHRLHPALIENRDTVGQLIRLFQIVCGQENRHPVGGVELTNIVPQRLPRLEIQP